MSDIITGYKKDRDAFGHMILDYLNRVETDEIIEREDGYFDVSSGCKSYFADFQEWPAWEQEAMQHLVPGHVLDLGCGAGRVELYLQSQGRPVTGIDNSVLAIKTCHQRGVQDTRLLSITQINSALGSFDNIIMFGNNWGLMGNRQRARWLLRKFHRMTGPGAIILAETTNIYQTESPFHLAYQAWNRERRRMSGQIRIRVHYQVYSSPWFDYLMVSREEMASILEGTGWRVQQFINTPRPYYIAVLEKEK
jgi:cyclopropane fatty-acyl-phospholipid synthase-like methyltransferase